jgi:hypothetical protein
VSSLVVVGLLFLFGWLSLDWVKTKIKARHCADGGGQYNRVTEQCEKNRQ